MSSITFQFCSFYDFGSPSGTTKSFKNRVINLIRESIHLTSKEKYLVDKRLETEKPITFKPIILGDILPEPPLVSHLDYHIFNFFDFQDHYGLIEKIKYLELKGEPNIIIHIVCDFSNYCAMSGIESPNINNFYLLNI